MGQIQKKPRYKSLVVLILLNLTAMLATWLLFNPGAQVRVIITLVVQLLFVPACAIWLLFFSGFSTRVRLAGLVAMIGLGIFLFTTVEIRDYSGDMVPIPAWRGSPSDDDLVATVKTADQAQLPHSEGPDFPRFLGPDANAMLQGVPLARSWAQQAPQVLWRQKIGAGWSAFSVFGGLAVTQEQRGEDEMVTCYRLEDGALVWAHSDKLRFSSSLGGDGPRATPTIDQGLVFTLGATGLLNCLDLAGGQKRWSRNLHEEHRGRSPEWGYSGSPLVVDDKVIVAIGGPDGRMLVAHDRQTGDFIWGGGSDAPGYATPQWRILNGVPQIIALNAQTLSAHNPENGSPIWEIPWGKGTPNAANPLVIDDNRLLVSSGYGVGCALLKISGDGPTQSVQRLYESTRFKAKFANFVRYGESIFGLDDGIMTCIDLATGERRWKKGRYGHGQLLLVDDLILLQSEDGKLLLLAADPEQLRELGAIEVLGDKSWNNFALMGNHLLMRNHMEAVYLSLPLAK